MDVTTTAYEWGLEWAISMGALSQDEEARYITVEEVMRDYDMKYPDTLTDSQWDDVCYCIREELSERLGES